MDETEEKQKLREEYRALLHAVRRNVEYQLSIGSMECEPKWLRTGLNAAMCDHAGLVRLLSDKGVFAKAEYLEAVRDELRREVARYAEKAPKGMGFA
jgi:hypothetical protein